VGVTSTVYSGRDFDYNMIIVRDACGTSRDQRAHERDGLIFRVWRG
jgi:hypothetical protein